MRGLDEKYLLRLIYELTITQRALFSQGDSKDFEIFRLIHNISSFDLQSRNINELHMIIKSHCKDDAILQNHVNYALKLSYDYSMKQ